MKGDGQFAIRCNPYPFGESASCMTSEDARPARGRVAGPPPAAAQVARALVIDDNFDLAESMTWMLEGLAQEIRMVHSGQAALAAAA